MIRAALLLLMLLLPACMAETPPPGEAPTSDPLPDDLLQDRPGPPPAELAGCTERGGIISIAGFSGLEYCAEPLPDAGQACTRASDCTGLCIAGTEAGTGTCQTHANPFGCNSYLDDNGDVQTICAD